MKKYDKQVDLHPTEFGPAERPEPFWGENAKDVAILLLTGFVVSTLAGRVIYGEWPYWLLPLLRSLLE